MGNEKDSSVRSRGDRWTTFALDRRGCSVMQCVRNTKTQSWVLHETLGAQDGAVRHVSGLLPTCNAQVWERTHGSTEAVRSRIIQILSEHEPTVDADRKLLSWAGQEEGLLKLLLARYKLESSHDESLSIMLQTEADRAGWEETERAELQTLEELCVAACLWDGV